MAGVGRISKIAYTEGMEEVLYEPSRQQLEGAFNLLSRKGGKVELRYIYEPTENILYVAPAQDYLHPQMRDKVAIPHDKGVSGGFIYPQNLEEMKSKHLQPKDWVRAKNGYRGSLHGADLKENIEPCVNEEQSDPVPIEISPGKTLIPYPGEIEAIAVRRMSQIASFGNGIIKNPQAGVVAKQLERSRYHNLRYLEFAGEIFIVDAANLEHGELADEVGLTDQWPLSGATMPFSLRNDYTLSGYIYAGDLPAIKSAGLRNWIDERHHRANLLMISPTRKQLESEKEFGAIFPRMGHLAYGDKPLIDSQTNTVYISLRSQGSPKTAAGMIDLETRETWENPSKLQLQGILNALKRAGADEGYQQLEFRYVIHSDGMGHSGVTYGIASNTKHDDLLQASGTAKARWPYCFGGMLDEKKLQSCSSTEALREYEKKHSLMRGRYTSDRAAARGTRLSRREPEHVEDVSRGGFPKRPVYINPGPSRLKGLVNILNKSGGEYGEPAVRMLRADGNVYVWDAASLTHEQMYRVLCLEKGAESSCAFATDFPTVGYGLQALFDKRNYGVKIGKDGASSWAHKAAEEVKWVEDQHPRGEDGRFTDGDSASPDAPEWAKPKPGDEDTWFKKPEVPEHLKKIPSMMDAIKRGVWSFKEKKVRDGYGQKVTEYTIIPNDIPESWETFKRVSGTEVRFNPELAEIYDDEGYKIVRLKQDEKNDIPEKAEEGIIYRGMSWEEYQNALKSGSFSSTGDYNIGDAQKGLTYFSSDPKQSEAYANGFAPWQFKATPSKPAVVVAIHDPGNHKVDPRQPTELGLAGEVPISAISHVFIGNAAIVTPGSVDIIEESRGGGPSEGSRSSPSTSVVWSREEAQKPKEKFEDQWPEDKLVDSFEFWDKVEELEKKGGDSEWQAHMFAALEEEYERKRLWDEQFYKMREDRAWKDFNSKQLDSEDPLPLNSIERKEAWEKIKADLQAEYERHRDPEREARIEKEQKVNAMKALGWEDPDDCLLNLSQQKERAALTATKFLGYPEEMVHFKYDEHVCLIGDKKFNAAGLAYIKPSPMNEFDVGHIAIYPDQLTSRAFVWGVMAHEIEHQKYQTVKNALKAETDNVMNDPEVSRHWVNGKSDDEGGHWGGMKADGSLPPPLDKKYPLYTRFHKYTEANNEMISKDGVTEYSEEYWNAYKNLKWGVSLESAYHETVAETAKLYHEYGDTLWTLKKPIAESTKKLISQNMNDAEEDLQKARKRNDPQEIHACEEWFKSAKEEYDRRVNAPWVDPIWKGYFEAIEKTYFELDPYLKMHQLKKEKKSDAERLGVPPRLIKDFWNGVEDKK